MLYNNSLTLNGGMTCEEKKTGSSAIKVAMSAFTTEVTQILVAHRFAIHYNPGSCFKLLKINFDSQNCLRFILSFLFLF